MLLNKKIMEKTFMAFSSVFVLYAFVSCSNPSWSGDTAVLPQDENATDIIPEANVSSITVKDLSSPLPQDFIRGFDASYVDYYEENNLEYTDSKGTVRDFFVILKEKGVNTVRLRLWVEPAKGKEEASDAGVTGDNDLARTVRMAQRAKKAGLKVLLDFHYSDYWADPGKQIIPSSWREIADSETMAEKISSYTKEVLKTMKTLNVLPDYVQVGNEIDSGILTQKSFGKTADSAVSGSSSGENFAKYIQAGCSAVRDVDSSIKIILHVTNRKAKTILDKLSSCDWDIAGLSYYPWEKSHGTIQSLKDNIKSIKNGGKEVMVVESSMYWNYGSYAEDCTSLQNARNNLINPETKEVYDDLSLKTLTVEGTEYNIVEGTLQNQVNVLRHIMEETNLSGGTGFFVWGADMPGVWKYSMFSLKGRAFDSLNLFSL